MGQRKDRLPTNDESAAAALIKELQEKAGLDPVDAHRGAFVALACARGWSKARIGRYLGISRARVGQKVDKLHYYAQSLETPHLRRVMKKVSKTKPEARDTDRLVLLEAEAWKDLDFARQLLKQVA